MNKRPAAATTAALGLSLALALSACSSADTDDSASGHEKSDSAVTVSHIHGLGIDPSDQRLYVATHEGIYTPGSKGTPKLVGESKDDFMGFTVAGGKTFYASGHPSADSGGPGNKGLIKSTDAGRTWKSLSLSGTSDFHALDYAHDRVYGYDATNGLLRTSKNGTDWKDGAELEALDIAVSPEEPKVVLATTARGVARSTNGGASFAEGDDPVLLFLSWAEQEGLYGIDSSGGLHRSADGGSRWKKAGTVPGGQPQALTAVSADRLLAATRDGVYESKDGGKTFRKRMAVDSGGGHH